MNKPKNQFELAAELKHLKDYKKELETLQTEAEEKIKRIEYELAQLMLDSGNDNFSLNGYKFTVTVKNRFNCPVENKEALVDTLKFYGYDRADVLTETIPWRKFDSIMQGIYEENGDKMPDDLSDIVSLFKQKGVSVRKESGKNGKSKAGKSFKRREHD